MIDYTRIALTVAASLLSIFWIVMYKKGVNKYDSVLEAIDQDEFLMADMFFVGFAIMETFHFNMDRKMSRKRIREVAEIYGAKYAQFHFYVLRGGQFTYGVTFLTVAFLLAALAGDSTLLLFGLIISALLVYYLEDDLNDKIKLRREELLLDFPTVLSKLTLLVNSGMVMREAWRKIALSGEGELYKEMQVTIQEMDNGVNEIDAYLNFANRCYVKEIRKFASTMIQNLQKGSAELVVFLQDMSDEMWEMKKFLAKKKGDAASSKIMMPTVMIFLGILIMILVPMLSGIEI